MLSVGYYFRFFFRNCLLFCFDVYDRWLYEPFFLLIISVFHLYASMLHSIPFGWFCCLYLFNTIINRPTNLYPRFSHIILSPQCINLLLSSLVLCLMSLLNVEHNCNWMWNRISFPKITKHSINIININSLLCNFSIII